MLSRMSGFLFDFHVGTNQFHKIKHILYLNMFLLCVCLMLLCRAEVHGVSFVGLKLRFRGGQEKCLKMEHRKLENEGRDGAKWPSHHPFHLLLHADGGGV